MRSYRIVILLLATIILSVQSLPVDSENQSSSINSENSDESAIQQKSSEQDSSIPDEISTNSDTDSSIDSAAVDENSEEILESRVVKRSPVIPDPDRYPKYDRDDRSDKPSAHPTHDEYLEWKSRQTRFRRNLEDDSINADYHEVQSFAENSLEDYAQGCEVMEENSDENNETTYNDYRKKREADKESVIGDSTTDLDVEKESDGGIVQSSEETQIDVKADEEQKEPNNSEEKNPEDTTSAAESEEATASNESNDDSSDVLVSEESEKP